MAGWDARVLLTLELRLVGHLNEDHLLAHSQWQGTRHVVSRLCARVRWTLLTLAATRTRSWLGLLQAAQHLPSARVGGGWLSCATHREAKAVQSPSAPWALTLSAFRKDSF